MQWNDPARPRLANSRPTWRDASIALPGVSFEPDELGSFTAEVVLPCDSDGGMEFASRHALKAAEVPGLLLEWADDPELAVVKWFGRSPPRQGRGRGNGSNANLDDKGVVEL